MTDHLALACNSWGPGPPRVLLIHGLSSAGPVWRRVGEELAAAGHSSLAPDLRGHGASPRGTRYRIEDYTADVLHSCRGPWDLVVGHSLGGAVAVFAQEAVPRFAARLLLIDPAIDVDADVAFAIRDQVILEAADPPTPQQLLAAQPGWHLQDAVDKNAALKATSPEVLSATVRESQPWDWGSRLVALSIPVHILGADPELEPLFTEATYRELAAEKSDLTFAVVPGAGHSIYRDDPDATIAAILDLLDPPPA